MTAPPNAAPDALAMLSAAWLSAAASVCARPATSMRRICSDGMSVDPEAHDLEGPIVRVAGFDTPFPYTLEHLYMPDQKRVLAGIEKTFVW